MQMTDLEKKLAENLELKDTVLELGKDYAHAKIMARYYQKEADTLRAEYEQRISDRQDEIMRLRKRIFDLGVEE